MRTCFCGCGRKVRRGFRAINKRGGIVNSDVAEVRELLHHGLVSPAAEMFVHDGELLCAALAEAIHVERDPGPLIESESRGFMAFARQNFVGTAWARAAQRDGLDPEEAVIRLQAGEWDPFAAVEIPTE